MLANNLLNLYFSSPLLWIMTLTFLTSLRVWGAIQYAQDQQEPILKGAPLRALICPHTPSFSSAVQSGNKFFAGALLLMAVYDIPQLEDWKSFGSRLSQISSSFKLVYSIWCTSIKNNWFRLVWWFCHMQVATKFSEIGSVGYIQ